MNYLTDCENKLTTFLEKNNSNIEKKFRNTIEYKLDDIKDVIADKIRQEKKLKQQQEELNNKANELLKKEFFNKNIDSLINIIMN